MVGYCRHLTALASIVSAVPEIRIVHDPHGEHEFGNFEVANEKFFFKIDYYAPNMEHGSEDPSDPSPTVRVLTIMLAEEY